VRLTLPLAGPRGEAIDLRRTLCSHGLIDLLPHRPSLDYRRLETTLLLSGGARTVRLSESEPGILTIDVEGRARTKEVVDAVRTMLALDDDLSTFYAHVAGDPQLAWAARGAGRLFRSLTAFEDVVKTILTTNCAWSATKRMNRALVENLGESARDGTHAFPTPAAMAKATPEFYRDVVRAGYRGPYLRALAASVASGTLDLEVLRDAKRHTLDDETLEARLRTLPGVGPYAAAHIMMLFGRRHRLVLDSATRPKYARLTGRKAKDATIVRRFARYRADAGLAFWLFLTRDWVEETE
jgi:3-methyladenine DNA glycosylase/8-oxoguanine DNA glycosylase